MTYARRVSIAVGSMCLAVSALALLWPVEQPAPAISSLEEVFPPVDERPFLAKTEVVSELIRGDITLTEAVARCQELDQEYPEVTRTSQRAIDNYFPGRTSEDRLANNLVALCAKTLEDDPKQAAAVLARLSAELEVTDN